MRTVALIGAIGSLGGCVRSSAIILAAPASHVALSGHHTQAKTIFSPGSTATARRRSVRLPSGTLSSQHSTVRSAPNSLKNGATPDAMSR